MEPLPLVEAVIVPRTRDLGGGFHVRRALPALERRLVGPFVFFDQFGPAVFGAGEGLDVRPHPHIGLSTLTYVFEGEILHRDSTGVVQPIRAGAVNWMTAGRGIVHSERTPADVRARGSRIAGIQTWLALPKAEEERAPSFQHTPADALPVLDADGVRARVVAGALWGVVSPVKTFTETLFVDAHVAAGSTLPVPAAYEERAVYIVAGALDVDGASYEAGTLLVLARGRDARLVATGAAHLIVVGGEPMDGPRHVWWNFVSSSTKRLHEAAEDWRAGRFGKVPGDDVEFIPLPEQGPPPVVDYP